MSKIIKLLFVAALILGAAWSSAAFAVIGDVGFYYGTEEEQRDLNKVLARLVRASVAKDQSGNTLLSESNCRIGYRGKHGCGTPKAMVDVYSARPDLAWVNLANLAEFLEGLEADENRGGRYDVASMRPTPGAPNGLRAIPDGVQRSFELGERAWVYHDKKTGRKIVVLMGHCGNPVYRLIPTQIIGGKKPCAYIPFYVDKPMSIVRFGAGGPRKLENVADKECLAVRKVGETEFTPGWRNECPTPDCSLKGAFAFIGKDEQLIGSYAADMGWHELRVPTHFAEDGSLFVTALCLEEVMVPTGSQTVAFSAFRKEWQVLRKQYGSRASNTTFVGWQEYRVREERSEARVWYGQADVPQGQPQLYWHWFEQPRQRITAEQQAQQAR